MSKETSIDHNLIDGKIGMNINKESTFIAYPK